MSCRTLISSWTSPFSSSFTRHRLALLHRSLRSNKDTTLSDSGSQVSHSADSIGSSQAITSKMIQSPDKFTLNFQASWLGGSYVANNLEPVNGELTFVLPSGAEMKNHLSKSELCKGDNVNCSSSGDTCQGCHGLKP